MTVCMHMCASAFVRACIQANQQITMDAGVRTAARHSSEESKIENRLQLLRYSHRFYANAHINLPLRFLVIRCLNIPLNCDYANFLFNLILWFSGVRARELAVLCMYTRVCGYVWICVCVSAHLRVSMCAGFCLSWHKQCMARICLNQRAYAHTRWNRSFLCLFSLLTLSSPLPLLLLSLFAGVHACGRLHCSKGLSLNMYVCRLPYFAVNENFFRVIQFWQQSCRYIAGTLFISFGSLFVSRCSFVFHFRATNK